MLILILCNKFKHGPYVAQILMVKTHGHPRIIACSPSKLLRKVTPLWFMINSTSYRLICLYLYYLVGRYYLVSPLKNGQKFFCVIFTNFAKISLN